MRRWTTVLTMVVAVAIATGCATPRAEVEIDEEYATNPDGSAILATDPETGLIVAMEVLKSRKIKYKSRFENDLSSFSADRKSDRDSVNLNRNSDATPGVEARAQDNQTFRRGMASFDSLIATAAQAGMAIAAQQATVKQAEIEAEGGGSEFERLMNCPIIDSDGDGVPNGPDADWLDPEVQ